jgi:hypothetical protein
MGNRVSFESTEESRFIASVESQLGLSAHSSLEVEKLIRRYILSGGRIHRRAVEKIGNDLRLPASAVLSAVYDAMAVSIEHVSAKTLLYFFISLSQGSPIQKAEQIWTLFDPEATDILTAAASKDLLETAFRCANDLVGFVVQKNTAFSEERLIKWRENLRKRKEKALAMFVGRYGTEGMTRNYFFQVLLTSQEMDLTNLLNIRTQIEKVQFIEIQAKTAFANFKRS